MTLGVLLVFAALHFFSHNPEKTETRYFFPKCPVKEHLGIYCSGCGSQRAVHDLLHFRIKDVFSHNFLFLPFLLLVFQHVLAKNKLGFSKSLIDYRHAPILILFVIVGFMVLRNIKGYPFEYLAP
ncbi:uncharacterized protein DUF2752 [Flagellimonas meridianipacifica]|uniref:Uncharacterized protein DUF2752 n=2 Tax=Flagellimonas meridianipacifica TaxID=1080225 RepID=A0A2T0M9D4_9FLAO|nr:uncharacterized protein DUF2752 [Allomuricauda pacifica]